MKGPERSLLAMPGDVLHSWGEETSAKADGSREQNKRTEAIFTSAVECPIDGQGRMVLPPLLREHAGITKEVCLTGLNNKIRIWNTDAWNEREAKLAAAREEILAELVW
jgi:MraZ protein